MDKITLVIAVLNNLSYQTLYFITLVVKKDK